MAGGGGLVCVDVHVLSLLPRTLGSRYDAIVAPGKMSEEKELDAIRCFFKSMISCDRVELTAEAKDKATDPLYKCLKNDNLTKVLNQTDQMQGRRQALGRKRARFSFKPNVGQDRDPLLCVETKLSVDHIKDPEEFFSAVEKMEYVEKVLKKLRGEVENESIENLKWTPSRKRRPGILGRRASYKHHFSSQLESIEADSLSQCENQALSPLKATKNPTFIPILLPKIQSGASRAGEADDTHIYNASDLQGSEAKEEKSVDHILSNLLYSFEDINEGDEIEFLEERLRIKSINMDKVCLPPLDRCLGNNLTITDGKKTSHSSEISSSNATRSPLASIAALKRRILRKDTLEDPFHMEALSDSSSENSSLNEGSHRSSKTRIRLNNRRNSLASTIAMRTPTSNPLANDIASTTIKDNTRDKVNATLFEEVDLPDQEMHLETSAGVVNTDSRRNSLASTIGIPDGVRTPTRNPLANDIASTIIKDNARNKVNATLFEGVDLPDQEMHLETSAGVVNTDSRRNSLASTIGIPDGVRTPTRNPLANDIASTIIKDNARNKVYAILFEEVDRPDQEMHLETSAGVVGTDSSKNGLFFEIGVLANNEVDDTLVEASLANKVDEADERSHLEETMACDRISFDNGTDGHSVETAAVANKKVLDVLETPASAGVSRSRRKRKLRSLTATQDDVTADVVCNPVETNYRGKVADETNQELHLRSIVSENRVLRNRSVDNGTGAISNTTNMVDFSSADESDDIHQEALITSEADCGNKESPLESANPKIPVDTALGNNVNGDSLEIVGPTMEKVNDVQENHASNNKGKDVESNSRSTIHKERPESTIQPSLTTPRIILNHEIDGIELGASSVVVPTAIDFSSEDENNMVNEETLITSEAGASADEIPVNYSVNADSLEIGDATAGKASDVQGVHMSNSKDQSSADVATNIPTNGCSESSRILDEHNTEVQDENQSNSTAALETEVPQKKQSKQKRTNRRQSLAGAGTAWQCGVRRSTRIRTKPLAHWRGERILYARIHDTLPTMIGMKYASPAKSDQKALPVLKVKSFVSEEYADLLQKVSLH